VCLCVVVVVVVVRGGGGGGGGGPPRGIAAPLRAQSLKEISFFLEVLSLETFL
jgi:hypothetical protein